MRKKLLAMLLAVVLAVGLLPGTVWAADAPTSGKCGDNVTWSFSDGTLIIQGTGPMDDYDWGDNYDLAIPWSDYRGQIHTIKIGDGITNIGDYAFFYCNSLTDVAIPNSVAVIGTEAFSCCYSLTSVTIPDGVTTIESGAFFSCYSLTNVSIPDSVTTIGDSAFRYCSSLTDVTIPNSVTTIGDSAFLHCDSLTSVTIPDGVTTIEFGTFYLCIGLTSVTIPDSVTSIGAFAFDSCISLTDVYYGGSESQWQQIFIDDDNDPLLNATIHYNSTGPEPVDPTEPEPEITFSDMPEDAWYAEYIYAAVELGFVAGDGAGHFMPDQNMTWGGLCVLLAELDGENVKVTDGGPWYQKAVDWVKSKGYATESTDPNASITWEDMITLLWDYDGQPGTDAWAWAVDYDFVSVNGGTLNPQDTADRATAIVVFMDYYYY